MTNSATKVMEMPTLEATLATWRATQEQVVFTNGCFDILHLGHVDYLEQARALGSKLVVGLNSDASVTRLKGPERPLNPQHARARILAALGFVDAVVLFEEDTPLQLILKIKPNILVKGSDYAIDDIVGAPEVMAMGGKVKTINLVKGFSTTGIIKKMSNQ